MKIIVDNLCRSFGNIRALDGVSFEIPDGAVCGFVGTNGAGKTTALRIMAGLDTPDCGSVFFDQLSATDYPEQIPAIAGFMPDTLVNAHNIRVREYLDFFARAFQLRGREKEAAFRRVSEYTMLDELLDRPLSALSKGMKQQVSLARVLIHDPPVLLLDEPAAGLDPRARVTLRESLSRLAQTGKTILISSHILSELEEMISSVIILERGKITWQGAPGSVPVSSHPRALLTFRCSAESVLETLGKYPFVTGIRQTGPRQIELTFSGGEADFAEHMAEIFRSGPPILAISRPDLSLEGMFLEKTTGEVQ